MDTSNLFNIKFVDYFIIIAYFAFVIGVGFVLKKTINTGKDFFLSGRSIPGWITSIAFLSANLGALELMGQAASGAQYGMLTFHYYWIGAIPAMLFLGLFMMPFYYATRIRSVPEFLKYRFNEATRGLNAISFAILMVLFAGISLYAMGLIFKVVLGVPLVISILISAAIVLLYVGLGGLTSSIYNEVTQFFLMWIGLLPLPLIGLHFLGGWNGMMDRLPEGMSHLWATLGSTGDNSMGVSWYGVILGLGFVLSFGYWMTDFLVVQRAFAAKDLKAAQNTPIYASFYRFLVPIFVIVPGMIALLLFPNIGESTGLQYNMALPVLMAKFYPPGILGLGITALLAAFMSGMAGTVTAFSSVWTYDIYQAYIKKDASDKHYIAMGRWAILVGVIIAVGAAFITAQFTNIMDYIQTIFSFFNAPLFGTFLLGVFWRRATGWGAFWGLLSGIVSSFLMYFLIPSDFYSSLAEGNFWRAWWAWVIVIVITIVVSLFTKRKPDAELKGLVFGLTKMPSYKGLAWYKRPGYLTIIVCVILVGLNLLFW